MTGLVAATSAQAVSLEEARVSRVIQDVRLLEANAAARAAAVNDSVKQGTAVRTGAESRAELTFSDLTITRIGQNSVFSIKGGTREVTLDSGAILVQVPHGGEPASVRTAAVTASISGGTLLLSANKGFPSKILVPEGLSHVCSLTQPGECADVHGGEMLVVLADGSLSKPEKFNGKLVYQTAHLLTDFPPLPNEYLFVYNDIPEENNGSPGNQGDEIDKTDQAHSGVPNPGSSTPPDTGKFGPPSTITSPDPYVIDGTTMIQTDPTITTNGVTDNGKIYRGADVDGSFSQWAFGSTNSFDTSSGFDDQIGHGSDPGGAGFKFSNLMINGDPIINTTNGETDLGLIAVNQITIDTVGNLNFAGIEGLLFATVNGPISVGNKTGIAGMRELTFYARGATSDLHINGGLNTERRINLYAGNDIDLSGSATTEEFSAVSGHNISITGSSFTPIDAPTISISAGHDLNLDDFETDKPLGNSIANVELSADHNIFAATGIYIRRTNNNVPSQNITGGGASSNMDVNIDAQNGDIGVGEAGAARPGKDIIGFLDVAIDNSSATLDNGANINIHAGGNLSVNAFGEFSLGINNQSGHIGTGGNITVSTGGGFFARTFSATINNNNGGVIDNGGSISFTIGGQFGVDNDATFQITSEHPKAIDVGGGNDPTIDIQADSINVGGAFSALIFEDGSPFASQGHVTVQADHDIVIGGDLECWGKVSAGTEDTVGNITVGGSVSVPTDLTATGSIDVSQSIFALNVSADQNVSAGSMADTYYLLANNLNAKTLNLRNLIQIGPDSAGSFGDINFSPDPMTWTVESIVTTGHVPLLASNGEDVSPDFGNDNPGNGGHVTLNITTGSLTIGSTGQIDHIEANGGNYDAKSTAGGNAGTVNLNVDGDVTLDYGSGGEPAISTTTGQIPGGGVNPSGGLSTMGEGGAVDIQASGSVSVNGTVIVSSNEFVSTNTPGGIPQRRSASGGDITIASKKTSGTAINVSSSAQLLSLLNNAAPGPGGTIRIVASNPGNNANNESNIMIDNEDIIVSGSTTTTIRGEITAQRGTVEIRHEGAMGTIGISDANIYGDIVKIGALGTSGALTIGGGFISAETSLKLYAPGSNGTIHFISPVTLTSNTSMSILLAANTITIDNGANVTIAGDAGMALVYTDHPNYNFTPGGGYTGPPPNTSNGSFVGNGANDPQPLASAPPFDDVSAAGRRGRTAAATNRGSTSSTGTTYRQVAVPQNGGVGHVRFQVPNDSTPRRP